MTTFETSLGALIKPLDGPLEVTVRVALDIYTPSAGQTFSVRKATGTIWRAQPPDTVIRVEANQHVRVTTP